MRNIILLLLVLGIFTFGCDTDEASVHTTEPVAGVVSSGENGPSNGTEPPGETKEPDGTEPSGENDSSDVRDAVNNVTLKYPGEYAEDVIISEREQDGVHTTLFTAKLGESTFDLFAVSFGEGGEGELFGYISTGGDRVPVYIKCYTLPENNGLNEFQMVHFYEMMDAINTVTESISTAEGFMYS